MIFDRFFQINKLSDLDPLKDIDSSIKNKNLNNFGKDFWVKLGSEWLNKIITFSIRVIIAIIVFIIARWVINKLVKTFEVILKKRKIEGVALTLIDSVLKALLYIILFVLMAYILGVKSVSFAAVLASMGLAVGMALSGQLQNLAGGVIIIFTKPFKIDDYIFAEGVEGVVKSVTLFHTQICTSDNRQIFIPNSKITGGVVTNYSHNNTRRCEWTIGIEYNEDFERVKKEIMDMLESDNRVLKSPEPYCVLHNLNKSTVDILIRCWTRRDDFWSLFWDFNKNIYKRFNEVGINFPFPQLTIHQHK